MINRFPPLKKFTHALFTALLWVAAFTFLVSAQGSASFNVRWGTLSGGGDRHTSQHYVIEDILGQVAIGNSDTTTTQGLLRVVGGFLGPTNPTYPIFLPSVKR